MSQQNHDIDHYLKIMKESKQLLNYNYFNSINKINYDKFLIYYKKLMDDTFILRFNNRLNRNLVNILGYVGLRFWQEYYYLFYLSLKIIKKYTDNSNIIGIGESPMKLIFSQSLFYKDQYIKENYLNKNGYPANLTFNYLPLSGLSQFSYRRDPTYYNNIFYEKKSSISKDSIIDEIIRLLGSQLPESKISDYQKYLEKMKYDPRTIIESQQPKFIFVDRGETFNTTRTFLYLYKSILLSQYKPEEYEDKLQIFISKFKLITFDGAYDQQEILASTLDLINRFCIKLFGTSNIYEHYLINLPSDIVKIQHILPEENPITKYTKNWFFQFVIPDSVINFLAIPEQMYLDTRCINSIKIEDLASATENVKDQKKASTNCNLSNLIIFIIFNKLKDDKSLLTLIKNLNFVDENKLSILNENSLNLELFSSDITQQMNTNRLTDYYLKIMTGCNRYDITNINSYSVKYDIPEDIINQDIINQDEYSNINFKYFDKYIKYKNKYLELKGGVSVSNEI